MSRDGLGILASILIFSAIITMGARVSHHPALAVTAVIMWIFFGFTLYFFRDPNRTIPTDPLVIISPADGKVTSVEVVHEPAFFDGQVTCVTIFLSIFNVHVNRIPVTGRVEFFDYYRGKFYPAFRKKATEENEQTLIGIRGEPCNVLVKQIAGVIARRIVCHVREGHRVEKGQRFGIIKFGSCVQLYYPTTVTTSVKPGDLVKGGETIIGTVNESEA